MQNAVEYQVLGETPAGGITADHFPTQTEQDLYAAIHDTLIVRLRDPAQLALAGDLIISLIESGKAEDIKVIEVLWVVFATAKSIDDKAPNSALAEVIKRVVETKKTDRHKLLERLDDFQLEAVGLVDARNFEKRRVRLLTKNRYEQQKFGLFREESEGFSKLCQELLEVKDQNKAKFEVSLQNITSLIGFFDLDYNRVIDLVLEFAVYNPGTELYFDLLKTFKKQFTGQILGFKFQRLANSAQPKKVYQGRGKHKKFGPGGGLFGLPINLKCLAKVAARLVSIRVLEPEEIWPHLEPKDTSIDQAALEIFQLNYRTAFDALYRIHNPSLMATVEQEEHAFLESEKELRGQCLYNQKLWLMQALVAENNFQEVERCFNLLGGKIDLHSHLPLLQSLCEFLEGYIEPAYRKISPSLLMRSRKAEPFSWPVGVGGLVSPLLESDHPATAFDSETSASRWVSWASDVNKILGILKSEISSSPNASTKLLRVCKALMKSANHNKINELVASQIQPVTEQIITWVKDYFLPGMILFEGNPQASQEIWLVIDSLDTFSRYQLYQSALEGIENHTPRQIFEVAHVVTQTKTFIRTLVSLKEDDKSNARVFAKMCHNAPLQVLTDILTKLQVDGYDNMIPSIVGAMSYSLPLSVDAALFLALKMLSRSDKLPVKEQDGVLASWIQNLAIFVGLLCKKHHKADLTGVLVFIANKLASDEDVEAPFVVLLKEVLTKMGGYEVIADLSEGQLSALGGGLALKTEACGLAEQVKAARKSSKSLSNVLWASSYSISPQEGDSEESFKLSMPFLLQVSLAKMRERVLLESTFRAPVMIEKLHELMTQCLFQISLVLLFHSENPSHYAQLLPTNTFQVLNSLKVQPEIAFKLLRPSLKPAFRLEAKEWAQLVANCTSYQESMMAECLASPSTIKAEELWVNVSKECFSLFWTLDVEKIWVPTEAYNAQIKQLTEDKAASDPNSKSKPDKQAEKKGKGAESLEKELQNLLKENEKFEEFFVTRKESIAKGFFKSHSEVNIPFLQYCCLPRLRLSAVDALFAARFVAVMLKHSGFTFLEQLIHRFVVTKHIFQAVGSCSEIEADHLGIFLSELLSPADQILKPDKFFSRLFPDAKKYDRGTHFAEVSRVRSSALLHSKELTMIAGAALRNSTYMQTRRILKVLIRMTKVFPISKDHMAYLSVALQDRIPNGWPSKAKSSLDLIASSYRQSLTAKESTTPDTDAKEMESLGWLAKGKIVQFLQQAESLAEEAKPNGEEPAKIGKVEPGTTTQSGLPQSAAQNGAQPSSKEAKANQKNSQGANQPNGQQSNLKQNGGQNQRDQTGPDARRGTGQSEDPSGPGGSFKKDKDSGLKGAGKNNQGNGGQNPRNQGPNDYYGNGEGQGSYRDNKSYDRGGYQDKTQNRDLKKYPPHSRVRRDSSSESKAGGSKRRDDRPDRSERPDRGDRGERTDRSGRPDRGYVDKRNPNATYSSGKDPDLGDRGEKRLKGDRNYHRYGDANGGGS